MQQSQEELLKTRPAYYFRKRRREYYQKNKERILRQNRESKARKKAFHAPISRLESMIKYIPNYKQNVHMGGALQLLGFSKKQARDLIKGDIDNLVYEAHKLYVERAKNYYPDLHNGDDTYFKQLNFAYHRIEHLAPHYRARNKGSDAMQHIEVYF